MTTTSVDWQTRFLAYDALRALLLEWQDRHPSLLSVEPIGTSPAGREVLLATVHDRTCSPPEDAPGLWVDANIHATEVTASVAALRVIWALLSAEPGSAARRALERRTTYVVARQNPDGAELALSAPVQLHRSRPDGDRLASARGIQPQDIDGDGRVLLMRISDPYGWWCRSEHDPRLLRPRKPHEDPRHLECFDVIPEGLLPARGPDGRAAGPLDLNRNYPYNWRPEEEQPGAGSAPLSEPEVRSVVDAILARPNLGAYLSYHTHGGVHLIPYGDHAELAASDRERYDVLAQVATELTGCPTEPTLPYWGSSPVYGASDDWFYDQLGGLAWTTEFWNPLAAAGVRRTVPEYWARFREEDDERLLRWSDSLGDDGPFVDWYPFEHSQLGPVELGGWDQLLLANPPARLLPEVLDGHEEFAVALALSLPELSVAATRVDPVGASLWRLEVRVENIGWLPTAVTERAASGRLCGPITCSLGHPETVVPVGESTVVLGQLGARPRRQG